MAKGNDGHLLQHIVELEAAAYLITANRPHGIYFALTHGMAPSESFDTGAARPTTSINIRSKLRVAAEAGHHTHLRPLIVQAFAELGASTKSYPNSARLIEWAAKRHGATLGGAVAEIELAKIARLREHFDGSSVAVLPGSWRQNLEGLGPPANLATPWIFSMDPMKFTNGADDDNDKMTTTDLVRLIPIWSAYARHDQPGLISVFSYSMQRDQREHFLSAIVTEVLPSLAKYRLGVLETLNYTSDFHVAALLSADENLLVHLRQQVLAVLGKSARDRDDRFRVPNNLFEVSS